MAKRLTRAQQLEAYQAEQAERDGKPLRGTVEHLDDKSIDEVWRMAEHVHAGDPFTVRTTFSIRYPALQHSVPAHADVFYCTGLDVALYLLATVDHWRQRALAAEARNAGG